MLVPNLLLSGLDLFNEEKFYEAHEIWEDLWRETQGSFRVGYQGLIQAAVALHHLQTGNRLGAIGLLPRATRNLRAGPSSAEVELDLEPFVAELEKLLDQLQQSNPPRGLPFPRIAQLK